MFDGIHGLPCQCLYDSCWLTASQFWLCLVLHCRPWILVRQQGDGFQNLEICHICITHFPFRHRQSDFTSTNKRLKLSKSKFVKLFTRMGTSWITSVKWLIINRRYLPVDIMFIVSLRLTRCIDKINCSTPYLKVRKQMSWIVKPFRNTWIWLGVKRKCCSNFFWNCLSLSHGLVYCRTKHFLFLPMASPNSNCNSIQMPSSFYIDLYDI